MGRLLAFVAQGLQTSGPAANTCVYATDRPRGARGPHHEPADVPVPVAGGGPLPAHAADVRVAGRRHQPAPPAEHQVTRLHTHMGSDAVSSIRSDKA